MSAAESPSELLDRIARDREASARPAEVHIAISGGRNRTPGNCEMEAFWDIWNRLGGTMLHHGDCPNPRGTDQHVARLWEQRTGRRAQTHPADWKTQGKAAGPIRNRQMMTFCTALIAFPGGRGTQTCVDAALSQGKTVFLIVDEIQQHRRLLERELIDPGLWGPTRYLTHQPLTSPLTRPVCCWCPPGH